MTGTFIISFDCEGKWGFADMMGPQYDFITEASLEQAYKSILAELARYNIDATFAFVGAFTMTAQQRHEWGDLLRDVSYKGHNWLHHYRIAERENALDGWFCPAALDMVKGTGHEIASHGFTHLPFNDPSMSRSDLEQEVDSALIVSKAQGWQPVTFVYPRNLIGHPQILQDKGFLGYRARPMRRGNLAMLAGEFNITARSEPHIEPEGGMSVIPPGRFFSWKHGPRKFVPNAVTVAQWNSVLKSACDDGGVAHLWLHPHNIISGPKTLDAFADVLKIASSLRDEGRLNIVTQAGYCARNGIARTA